MLKRKESHELFVRNKVDCIVATIAFGMGIDKPDIRNVIHYGASKSIENYYQEVGRAGRDGLLSKCVMFFSGADFTMLRYIGNLKGSDGLKKFENYLETRQCRRNFILNYFQEELRGEPEISKAQCCDNCSKRLYDHRPDMKLYQGMDREGKYDFTKDAHLFLESLSIGRYSIGTYISFIRGSRSAKIKKHFQKKTGFGSGKDKSEAWWKGIGKILVQREYAKESKMLSQQGFSYIVLKITPKRENMLKLKENLFLIPPSSLLKLLKTEAPKNTGWLSAKNSTGASSKIVHSNSLSKSQNIQENDDLIECKILYYKLLEERTKIAEELDCMPYMVAPNATIMTLSRLKPTGLQKLRTFNLDGLNEIRIMKFGQRFLNIINQADIIEETSEIYKILTKYPIAAVSQTAQLTYNLHRTGSTIFEIAVMRGITIETTTSHLISSLKLGYPVKLIEFGVSDEIRNDILKNYRTLCPKGFDPSVRLKSLKDLCPETYTYDQIRAVLSYFQIRCHLETLKISYEDFEDFPLDNIIAAQGNTVKSNNSTENINFTNKELKQVCEDLEARSVNSEDLDVINVLCIPESSPEGEPPAKKEKIEEFNYLGMLDSPPSQYKN